MKALVLLLLILTGIASVHADSPIGNSFTCEGSSIISPRARTLAFAQTKTKLNRRIEKKKAQIAQSSNADTLAALRSQLRTLRLTRKLARFCSQGTLDQLVAPLWNDLSGSFTGPYEIISKPSDIPVGSGNIELRNAFDGQIFSTELNIVSGILADIVSDTVESSFNVVGITFPFEHTIMDTAIGDVVITVTAAGSAQAHTVIPDGLYAGSEVDLSLEFDGTTISVFFTFSNDGQIFLEGTAQLQRL